MRFYLNFPLVAGYVLMAAAACLGVLQLTAARSGYAGLSLFTTERKRGLRIGAGVAAGALLAYMLLAPEILTPGPAGTEVAEMFALCAVVALGTTLVGADLRLRRARAWQPEDGQVMLSGDLPATLLWPSPSPHRSMPEEVDQVPAVVLVCDPTGLVVTPSKLVEALCQAGIGVLIIDPQQTAENKVLLARPLLLGHISTALAQLTQMPRVDHRRTGLLGMGLGGDAALRIAASDPKIAAVMAASPISELASKMTSPGLHWLHELSYRQAWRLRRRWARIQSAAADLNRAGPTDEGISVTTVVNQASAPLMTMRKTKGHHHLTIQSKRYFNPLEDEPTLRLVVRWFQENLDHGTS